MSELINIYCDESCHLFNETITDDNRFMVIGGISCPDNKKREVFDRIKEIKKRYNLMPHSELKWNFVKKSTAEASKDIINFFFDVDDLIFRAIIIDKKQLSHEQFNQTHNDFYYKIYWQMLEWFISPEKKFHIYLDIKDTQGVNRVKSLHDVLSCSKYDFNKKIIQKIQQVRSHEIPLMQLNDLLIGAVSSLNRYHNQDISTYKKDVIHTIQKRSGLTLDKITPLGARKFNLFHWRGRL